MVVLKPLVGSPVKLAAICLFVASIVFNTSECYMSGEECVKTVQTNTRTATELCNQYTWTEWSGQYRDPEGSCFECHNVSTIGACPEQVKCQLASDQQCSWGMLSTFEYTTPEHMIAL